MDSILIVDDERGIRDTLRAVMEDEGFVAEAVSTGEECLKALGRRAHTIWCDLTKSAEIQAMASEQRSRAAEPARLTSRATGSTRETSSAWTSLASES